MRRFPPPWSIDKANDACFIVRYNTGQALGYFYFEDEPGRRSAAKLLTRDEARRLAVNSLSCRNCCGGTRDRKHGASNQFGACAAGADTVAGCGDDG